MKISDLNANARLKIEDVPGASEAQAGFHCLFSKIQPFGNDQSNGRIALVELPSVIVAVGEFAPCILDVSQAKANASLAFFREHPAGALFNGREVDAPLVGLQRAGAGSVMVSAEPFSCGFVVFKNPMQGRGWPEVGGGTPPLHARAESFEAMRALLDAILRLANGNPAYFDNPVQATEMRNNVVAAADEIFRTAHPLEDEITLAFGRHFHMMDDLDRLIDATLDEPIYTEALMKRFGVSNQTLHRVMLRFRGMSLHRYVRLKRLYAVRGQLKTAPPGAQIRHFAAAYGFHHMGQFSIDYSRQFGETPTETLRRARA